MNNFPYNLSPELQLLIFHIEAIHDFTDCNRTENEKITPEFISEKIKISKWSSIVPILDGYTDSDCNSTSKKINGFEDKVIKYIKTKNPITELLLDDDITPAIRITNSDMSYSFTPDNYKLTVKLLIDKKIINSKNTELPLYYHKENVCKFLKEYYKGDLSLVVDTENFLSLDDLFDNLASYFQHVDESNKYDMGRPKLRNNIVGYCIDPTTTLLQSPDKLSYNNLGTPTKINLDDRVDSFLDTQYGIEFNSNKLDLDTLVHLPSLLEMANSYIGIYLLNNMDSPICDGGIIIYNKTTDKSIYIFTNIANTFNKVYNLSVKRLAKELYHDTTSEHIVRILNYLDLHTDKNTAYLLFDIKRCGDFGQIYNCKHYNKIFTTIDKLAHMYARLVGCNTILLSQRNNIPILIAHRNILNITTISDIHSLIYDKYITQKNMLMMAISFMNDRYTNIITYYPSEYGTNETYILFKFVDIVLHIFHKIIKNKLNNIIDYISKKIPSGTSKIDTLKILKSDDTVSNKLGYVNDITLINTSSIDIYEYNIATLNIVLSNIPILQLKGYMSQIIHNINTPSKLLNNYINKLVDYVNYFNETPTEFSLPTGSNIFEQIKSYCDKYDDISSIPPIDHFTGGAKPVVLFKIVKYDIILQYHPTDPASHNFNIYSLLFSNDTKLLEKGWELIRQYNL